MRIHPQSGQIRLHQPEFDLDDEEEPINTGIVAPICRPTQGVSQHYLRRLIRELLGELAPQLERSRPGPNDHTLGNILWTVHFPREPHHARLARRELAGDEVLELQLAPIHRQCQGRHPAPHPEQHWKWASTCPTPQSC